MSRLKGGRGQSQSSPKFLTAGFFRPEFPRLTLIQAKPTLITLVRFSRRNSSGVGSVVHPEELEPGESESTPNDSSSRRSTSRHLAHSVQWRIFSVF